MSKTVNIIDRLKDVWRQLKESSLVKSKNEDTNLESEVAEFQELVNLCIPITEAEKTIAETVRSLFGGHKVAFHNFLTVSHQEHFALLTEGGIIAHLLGVSHLVIIQTGEHGRYQVVPNDLYKETYKRTAMKAVMEEPVKILKRVEAKPAEKDHSLEDMGAFEKPRKDGERPRRRRSKRGGHGRHKRTQDKEDRGLEELVKNIKSMKALKEDIPEVASPKPNKKTSWVEVAKKPPAPPKEEEPCRIEKKTSLSSTWGEVSDSDE